MSKAGTYQIVEGPQACQRCGDTNLDSLFVIRAARNREAAICIGCLYTEAKRRSPRAGDIRLVRIVEWLAPLEGPTA